MLTAECTLSPQKQLKDEYEYGLCPPPLPTHLRAAASRCEPRATNAAALSLVGGSRT